MKSSFTAFCLVISILEWSVARIAPAGFVVTFEPSLTTVNFTVNATEQFTVSVRGAADVGTQAVQGYTIPVDLRLPNAKGLPSGWSVVSVNSVANFSGGTLFSGNTNPGEGDLSGADVRLAGPLSFDTTPTTLFQFTVQINRATATNGDFSAAVLGTSSLFAINDSIATTLPLAQVNLTNIAQIRVTGVPEPGSLALLGLISAITTTTAIYRRRS